MLAVTESAAIVGTQAVLVEVQVHSGNGIPVLSIVGLPARSVRESEHRTRAGLESTGQKWPAAKMIANLAPGRLPKEGTHFDLPLALGILASNDRIPAESLKGWVVVGEIGLNGDVRPIPGVLAAAITCREAGRKGLMCPTANAPEAALVEGIEIVPVNSLAECIDLLRGDAARRPVDAPPPVQVSSVEDMSELRGQADAKVGAEVAAAGGHNLLLKGPPGSGKTMLARRIAGILPRMSQEEALDVTRTYSIAGLLGENPSLITSRPVRTPHHHTSLAGLIGGGSGLARPGEIALANHGVLFLDELPLYARHVLEALRGPVEDGVVRIARSSGSVSFPCRFSLVAAMNPCPCGFTDDPTRICRCSSMQLSGYRGRLSGPLLDRFDLRIEMARVPSDQLFSQEATESSAVIRERVEAARAVQRERYDSEVACNATVSRSILRRHLNLSTTATRMLKDAADEMHLTGRGVDRLQRVSRTIADLAGSGAVLDEHLGFALYLRYVGPDEEVAA